MPVCSTNPPELAGHSVDVHENEYRQPQTTVLKRATRKLERRLQ
jgi:hypothetical protein